MTLKYLKKYATKTNAVVSGLAVALLFASLFFWRSRSPGETLLSKQDFLNFSRAQTLYREKKFDQSEDLLKKILKTNPGHLETTVMLAKLKFFTRKFGEAEAILDDYLEKNDPDNPYALMWLGRILSVQENKAGKAEKVFQKILLRDPENFVAHYYFGRSLEDRGKIKEALFEYQSAIAMTYQLSKIHLHMGELLNSLGLHERADQHLRTVKVLDINPNDVRSANSPEKEATAKNEHGSK